MKITTINLPIYFIDIVVIIDYWEEANKKFKLQFLEEDYKAEAWTIYNQPYLPSNEIFLMFKSTSLDYNTVCHELVHCISGVCSIKGILMDPENDEALAYLQGYIGEKVFEFIDNHLENSK